MCIDSGVNLFLEARDAEYELVPIALDQECSIPVWIPLAGGLFSGKYRRSQETEEGRHLGDWDAPSVRTPEKLYDTIEVLVEIVEEHSVSAFRNRKVLALAASGLGDSKLCYAG
jgi:aryl-alcohol dehydrogenase-like predicted oxidoreductase